jgi:ribonuclease J
MNKSENSKVEIKLLGGVGEFGRNCSVISSNNTNIMIDCGIMFANDPHLGIDALLPKFGDVKQLANSLDAVLVTHGHEDHVGALGWLIKHKQIPIYATAYSIAHIKNKIKYLVKNIDDSMFVEIKPGDTVNIKGTKVTFIAMTHSIPSAVAIAVETPQGIIFHTGDFKLDHTPVEGTLPDFHLMSSMGNYGVLALLSDSTNARSTGWTPSESSVRTEIDQILAVNNNSRVLFVTFSSHMHRVKQIIDASIANGRKICVLGRSMHQHMTISKELDINDVDDKHIIPESELADYTVKNKGGVSVICTGSQGEILAVLSKYAKRNHKSISVQKGDVVVMSSHTIPGNEKGVAHIEDELREQNVRIYTEVHVSGHAAQEELKHIIAITKPKLFMPIHGEVSMIKAHKALAEQMGYTNKNIIEAKTGQTVSLFNSKGKPSYKTSKAIEADNDFIYTNKVLLGKEVINQRKDLAKDGMLVATFYVGQNNDVKANLFSHGWLEEEVIAQSLMAHENMLNEEVRHLDIDTITQDHLYGVTKKIVYNPLKKKFGRVANLYINIVKK